MTQQLLVKNESTHLTLDRGICTLDELVCQRLPRIFAHQTTISTTGSSRRTPLGVTSFAPA